MKQNGWRRERSGVAMWGPGDLRMALLAAALIVASFATPVEAQGERTARISVRNANLRSQPGLQEGSVIAGLREGETVTILAEEAGDRYRGGVWYHVRTAGSLEGYLHSSVVAEVTPVSMEETVSDVLDTADLSDEESAELAEEIRELRAEADAAEASGDTEEAEDLRAEVEELTQELRDRQAELREERLAAQAAWEEERREAELEVVNVAQGGQGSATRNPGQRQSSGDTDWTGFYLGVNAGYGFGDEVTASNSLGTSPEGDIDGFDVGIQIGYSYQFSRFVLGIEGDYQISGQSGSTDLDTIGFPGSSLEYEQDSFGTARVRAGFAVGRILLYATGGYAYADVEGRFAGPIADLEPNRSVSFAGFTVGAGAETALTDYFSLKGEIIYLEFDDEPEIASEGGSFSARVGVNWRF